MSKKKSIKTLKDNFVLTDNIFHVVGLYCRGIPDQLNFRSSSESRK